jgi:hypothetical protein
MSRHHALLLLASIAAMLSTNACSLAISTDDLNPARPGFDAAYDGTYDSASGDSAYDTRERNDTTSRDDTARDLDAGPCTSDSCGSGKKCCYKTKACYDIDCPSCCPSTSDGGG